MLPLRRFWILVLLAGIRQSDARVAGQTELFCCVVFNDRRKETWKEGWKQERCRCPGRESESFEAFCQLCLGGRASEGWEEPAQLAVASISFFRLLMIAIAQHAASQSRGADLEIFAQGISSWRRQLPRRLAPPARARPSRWRPWSHTSQPIASHRIPLPRMSGTT